MSDSVMEKLLHTWREKFGETTSGKKYGNTYTKIPVRGRKEALIVFFKQMKALGYDKERFSRQTFVAELIPFVFGEAPWFNKEQQRRAHGALATEVKDILLGDIWDDEKTKEESSKLFSESPDALPIPKISVGGAGGPSAGTVTAGDSIGTTHTSIPGEGSNSEEPIAPIPEGQRLGKEVDRSLYAHIPKTKVFLDEEFAKLIGVDPDE